MSKKLTNENYYEQDKYMSVSAYKKFLHCECDGLEEFKSPSTAFQVGAYVDAYVENTLDKYKEEHPEIISTRGTTKGELKADFKYADKICEYIDNDPIFKEFMSGEKQTIMAGEIMGVPFKIKMDSYSPDIAINDLKVMATVTNRDGEYYDFISRYGYDIQMACYQEIVYQNTGKKLPCYICAVTKESTINSVIVIIPQYVMDRALFLVTTKIQRFYDIKMGKVEPIPCGKCPSCIAKRKETPIISMEDMIDFIM